MRQINEIDECCAFVFSSLYQSTPLGPADQPDYINAVVGFLTRLQPAILLGKLQSIEQDHGRARDGEKWTARTLDLDILVYDQLQQSEPTLCLPHAGISARNFVLFPLREIAPTLWVPGHAQVSALAKRVEITGIEQLPS